MKAKGAEGGEWLEGKNCCWGEGVHGRGYVRLRGSRIMERMSVGKASCLVGHVCTRLGESTEVWWTVLPPYRQAEREGHKRLWQTIIREDDDKF